MTTVGDILNFIETLAPAELKIEWDKIGLNCGRRSTPVTKVLLALDPFTHVCKEAIDWGAQLLVTHHPLIFHPIAALTDETPVSRSVMDLCRHDISHVCAHTNLDCAQGGVNDVLAEILGLSNFHTIADDEWGLIRLGEVPEQTLDTFLANVKNTLHCKGLRYCDGGKPVRKVAVGGGGCANGLTAAIRAGCDTFVTSDINYNGFWDAYEQGINFIDAGHFYTENPVIAVLAQKIAAQFPEIQVKISETHGDCMKFY